MGYLGDPGPGFGPFAYLGGPEPGFGPYLAYLGVLSLDLAHIRPIWGSEAWIWPIFGLFGGSGARSWIGDPIYGGSGSGLDCPKVSLTNRWNT